MLRIRVAVSLLCRGNNNKTEINDEWINFKYIEGD